MTKQAEEINEEKLEKALNEIDGLDNKEQQIYRIDSDTFRFKDVEYKLIEDYKEAFDIEMMEERFTDYLLKYDYIVGDIAYEKLRLRGFFEDYRKGVPVDMKISNLEDYLVEYCNFGCQYFVFERVEKKTADPDSYFKRSKRPVQSKYTRPQSRRNNPNNRTTTQNKKARPNTTQNKNKKPNTQQNTNTKPRTSQSKTNRGPQKNRPQQSKNEAQKEFQVVKKQEVKAKPTQQDPKNKPVKATKKTNNKQFEIRKKTD